MSCLYRADDVPPASRLDYLRHVIARTLVPQEHRFDHGPEFEFNIRSGELGAVRLTESQAGPGTAVRTGRLIRCSDPEVYLVGVVAEGRLLIEQDERRAVLQPGDLTLFDSSRPGRKRHLAMRSIVVGFPRSMLPLPSDDVRRLTAVPHRGDEGVGSVVSALVRDTARRIDDVSPAEAARFGRALVDLLTVLFAGRLNRAGDVPSETSRHALLRQVYAYLDRHLDDPSLGPGTVAAAHHVSVRALYKLFESEPRSISAGIRQARLDRCRRDLLDPALADRPVGWIAARWGLPNHAHFSRLFRATYGCSPSELRRNAVSP